MMESINGMTFFVHAAETRSFSEAGRILGVSSSAVGKSITRLEDHLGVRLFHRSTRSMTLTAEGHLFLERCRRILSEIEAAELELSQTQQAPQGRLRISLPLVGMLVVPALNAFMQQYPAIQLDIDFSDRLVDVIEEGFDVVIRTGQPSDSRLMARQVGHYQLQLVASPQYLARAGTPQQPLDLQQHQCLHHKFPTTGKLEQWPIRDFASSQSSNQSSNPASSQSPSSSSSQSSNQSSALESGLPISMVSNMSAALLDVAIAGSGITCLPNFMLKQAIARGELVTVLDDYVEHQGTFWLLWPSSKHLSPKLRVFIDFMVQSLFPDQ